jgi:hypothetical protein
MAVKATMIIMIHGLPLQANRIFAQEYTHPYSQVLSQDLVMAEGTTLVWLQHHTAGCLSNLCLTKLDRKLFIPPWKQPELVVQKRYYNIFQMSLLQQQ